jgi:hypothetical protein
VGGNDHGISYYCSISLDRLREVTRNVRQDGRCPTESRTGHRAVLEIGTTVSEKPVSLSVCLTYLP